MDLNKDGHVLLRVFEVEAYKLGIYLSDNDMRSMLKRFADPQQKKVRYGEVIKLLVLAPDSATESEDGLRWTLEA